MKKLILIPAAGKAVRLRPISNFLPKLLLPIKTTPCFDFIIKELHRYASLTNKDKIKISLSTEWYNQKIEKYLVTTIRDHFPDVQIEIFYDDKQESMAQSITDMVANEKGFEEYFVILPDVIIDEITLKHFYNNDKEVACVFNITHKEQAVNYGTVIDNQIVEKPSLELLDQQDWDFTYVVTGRYKFDNRAINMLIECQDVNKVLNHYSAKKDLKEMLFVVNPTNVYDVGNPDSYYKAYVRLGRLMDSEV
jgi:NDP-sugar pyrophosphorylase family protein